jgi:hypothetical protein
MVGKGVLVQHVGTKVGVIQYPSFDVIVVSSTRTIDGGAE